MRVQPYPRKAPIIGWVLIARGSPVATQFDSVESARAFCSEWDIKDGILYAVVGSGTTARALATWEMRDQEGEEWKL